MYKDRIQPMTYSVDKGPEATTLTFQPTRMALPVALGGVVVGCFFLYTGIQNAYVLGIILGCGLLLLGIHMAATILTGYNILRLSEAGIAVKQRSRITVFTDVVLAPQEVDHIAIYKLEIDTKHGVSQHVYGLNITYRGE